MKPLFLTSLLAVHFTAAALAEAVPLHAALAEKGGVIGTSIALANGDLDLAHSSLEGRRQDMVGAAGDQR